MCVRACVRACVRVCVRACVCYTNRENSLQLQEQAVFTAEYSRVINNSKVHCNLTHV